MHGFQVSPLPFFVRLMKTRPLLSPPHAAHASTRPTLLRIWERAGCAYLGAFFFFFFVFFFVLFWGAGRLFSRCIWRLCEPPFENRARGQQIGSQTALKTWFSNVGASFWPPSRSSLTPIPRTLARSIVLQSPFRHARCERVPPPYLPRTAYPKLLENYLFYSAPPLSVAPHLSAPDPH